MFGNCFHTKTANTLLYHFSDETAGLCQNVYCPKYGFQCSYGACVSGKALCNKKKECFDNSDELESLCKPKVECKYGLLNFKFQFSFKIP